MKEAYRKQFVVIDNTTGIPIGNQPLYTLQQAIDRVGREEQEAIRLFGIDRKEARTYFGIMNTNTGEQVL